MIEILGPDPDWWLGPGIAVLALLALFGGAIIAVDLLDMRRRRIRRR